MKLLVMDGKWKNPHCVVWVFWLFIWVVLFCDFFCVIKEVLIFNACSFHPYIF